MRVNVLIVAPPPLLIVLSAITQPASNVKGSALPSARQEEKSVHRPQSRLNGGLVAQLVETSRTACSSITPPGVCKTERASRLIKQISDFITEIKN